MRRKLVSFSFIVICAVPLQIQAATDAIEIEIGPHSHISREENEADNNSDADTVCSEDDVVLGTRSCCNDAVIVASICTFCITLIIFGALAFSCKIPPFNNYQCGSQECVDTEYCDICGCRNETNDLGL